MKKLERNLKISVYAICFLVLILESKYALQGAQEGIRMCLKAIIPSLFPFFMITGLLTNVLNEIKIPGEKRIVQILDLPDGCIHLLIPGLLGGYPVGAQCISQCYQNGQLSKQQAHRLLGFCSNAGPAFIFGICGLAFESKIAVWMLWIIHILSALITAMLLPRVNCISALSKKTTSITISQALENAVKTTGIVCGWIIIFRIILNFIKRWIGWYLPDNFWILAEGGLELSNGCIDSMTIANQSERFILLALLLGFGGLCVIMQTVSVTKKLGTGLYIPGKILQGSISALLAGVIQYYIFQDGILLPLWAAVIPVSLIAITLAVLYSKKTVAIYRKLIYNKEKSAKENIYAVSKKATQSL